MTNTNLETLAGQVETALANAGYEVRRGKPHLWGISGCDSVVPAFGNCFGNNPAAPYIIPIVPHLPGEAYQYGPSMEWGVNEEGEPLYATYRLRPDEAIVTLGFLPPPGAYFGFETFLFTRRFDPACIPSGACPPEESMDWLTDAIGLQRQLSPNPDSILYLKTPRFDGLDQAGNPIYTKDPNRIQTFANMGPTINNRVLGNLLPEGSCWGQQAVLSASADRDFLGRLDAELGQQGSTLAGRCVANPLGAELDLGLDQAADDFWTVIRYAVPVDPAEGNHWRDTLASQLVVLRATPAVENTAVDRYSIQTFPEKTVNTDERELAADLQGIASEIQARLGFGPTPQEVFVPTSQIPLFGPVALSRGLNNLGATHDTDTYRLSSARDFENGAVFAVVGVNHVLTRNASYVSVGFYNSEILTGLFSISEGVGSDGPAAGPLTGSVEEFFDSTGGLPPALAGIDSANFYVHILARPDAVLPAGLEGSRLVTIVETQKGEPGTPHIGLGIPVRVSQRAYLNPEETAECCGADPKRTLSPILVANDPNATE